jgi:hypothetical protein
MALSLSRPKKSSATQKKIAYVVKVRVCNQAWCVAVATVHSIVRTQAIHQQREKAELPRISGHAPLAMLET